ncbi:MAG: hypothetical protein M1817_000630 [Caeruleum heppii]|nr:MAG: hypothetical protein M1817_000630 [Caeruleum heppii]
MSSSLLPPLPLPAHQSLTSTYLPLPSVSLNLHLLTAGHSTSTDRPLLILLHGFPELAYSWRHVIPPLAAAGYHVVAPDQRGYGRTTGWDTSDYHGVDLRSFSIFRLVADVVALIHALGYTEVAAVIGHDFGAVVAAFCALIRPEMFKSVVMMSHPFKGPPAALSSSPTHASLHFEEAPQTDIHTSLAHLHPPRKHYKTYYSTPSAATDLLHPISTLHPFLRAYFHTKSFSQPSSPANPAPYPLRSWTATELGQMPHYYIMPLEATMREAVLPPQDEASTETTVPTSSTSWLPDDDLAVYVSEWSRTGFQGALNWYRVATSPDHERDLQLFAGRMIEVPAMFVAGVMDWGAYQEPGALEGGRSLCADWRGVKMVDGAGHWVQQERPEEVVRLLLEFLRGL